jgi:hypothetical protein
MRVSIGITHVLAATTTSAVTALQCLSNVSEDLNNVSMLNGELSIENVRGRANNR